MLIFRTSARDRAATAPERDVTREEWREPVAIVKKSPVRKTSVKQSPAKSTAKTTAKSAAKPVAKAAATKKSASDKPASKPAAAGKAAAAPVDSPLKIGAPAPGFSLLDDSGRTVTLGEFRGRKVVLYFYPKDSTPGCTQQACDFRDNLARIGKRGAVVLGVSADSVESHKRFKGKQGLTFPLLSDPERKALEAYGVWQEKSLYGRKFMGIVRTTVILDEQGKVAKVFPKVKVGGHVDEVLASL